MSILLDELYAGARERVWSLPDGAMVSESPTQRFALYPGSFNPRHDGHRGLCAAAARYLGCDVFCELSIINADKPALARDELQRRRRQFEGERLLLTRAATFVEKSQVMAGCVFVVGADTALRIVDPRFYEDSAPRMHSSLGRCRHAGCRFLVAGRVVGDRFLTLADCRIAEPLQDLFEELPEECFRLDIDATSLRNAAQQGDDEC